MKIKVDKIPADGVTLKEKLDPKNLFLGMEEQGISFLNPVSAEAVISKTGNEVFVDMALEVDIEYTCSRCLAKIKDVFKKKFNVNHEMSPGDILEIDEDIRQEMILGYPMKVICKADCKGLCVNCGQNLNVAKCECK
ncbi:DUF177 domain-containing protein [Candidatus Omnitrophota bacterium]